MRKPDALAPGDRVAAVTLSWGGPGQFPARYEAGKRQLEEEFGLTVVPMRHALRDPDWVRANPAARADDLMQAFADPTIRGVVSTIGGEDSVRILPYLDLSILAAHPKVFLGYSDTTVTHLALHQAGVVSFYGPSIMAGFAENGGMHRYLVDCLRALVFDAWAPDLEPNRGGWTEEHLDWADPTLQERPRALNPSTGWRVLQGTGTAEGPLLGGCLEVLDWLRGTPVWPEPARWEGAVLFLETSEEGVPPSAVTRFLRSLAAMGVLQRVSALLFGRPGGTRSIDRFPEYDRALLGVVRDELGLTDLPVVAGMDFGHTDPMLTLPYGIPARVDCATPRVSLLEAAVLPR